MRDSLSIVPRGAKPAVIAPDHEQQMRDARTIARKYPEAVIAMAWRIAMRHGMQGDTYSNLGDIAP